MGGTGLKIYVQLTVFPCSCENREQISFSTSRALRNELHSIKRQKGCVPKINRLPCLSSEKIIYEDVKWRAQNSDKAQKLSMFILRATIKSVDVCCAMPSRDKTNKYDGFRSDTNDVCLIDNRLEGCTKGKAGKAPTGGVRKLLCSLRIIGSLY